MTVAGLSDTERARTGTRITWRVAGANLSLSLLKVLAGYFGHSQAVLADGVHSASDFVTDILLLVSLRIAAKPPDAEHQYGHKRVETLMAAAFGLILLGVGASFVRSGIVRIDQIVNHGLTYEISWIAMAGALLTAMCKEYLYHYNFRWGAKLSNQGIVANAWENRSDAMSSFGTFMGITAAVVGGQRWTVLDPIITVIVAVLIIRFALGILLPNMNILIGRSADQGVVASIKAAAESILGVQDAHSIRTRFEGSDLVVDLHLNVLPTISVASGHELAEQVENRIKGSVPSVDEVVVHVEPGTPERVTRREP
jgi:cation diffusion facilitator family transporter